ncbi:hypothetical protein HBH92_042270 [Parastagonospora nodorum]|nr:hypothetical protein HBH50_017310 [Parastagonospora nodorum]KAH4079792.1 hypothetical protein HBH46_232620 [Parastagonospora nodorum]KAH4098217.1 hypothetical protein HBH48_030000 [Parastagonospora nodorum]KAH4180715.1 hypothetical protein HBH43_007860 [Parastagonospora nodorum]KAH4201492.1 hypothetical protein HBH42_030230 [Parastagonospora nodorum]
MRISLISVSERANKFVLRQTFVRPHPYSPTFHNVHDGTPYTLRKCLFTLRFVGRAKKA